MKHSFHTSAEPDRSIWSFRDVWLMLPARALVAAGNGLALVTLLLRVHDSGRGPLAVAGAPASASPAAVAHLRNDLGRRRPRLLSPTTVPESAAS